jgi:hypothetical protein
MEHIQQGRAKVLPERIVTFQETVSSRSILPLEEENNANKTTSVQHFNSIDSLLSHAVEEQQRQ